MEDAERGPALKLERVSIEQDTLGRDGEAHERVPATVTDAVLKPSQPLPDGAVPVEGIDFNRYAGRDITAGELVAGMSRMGFQATAVGEAVRIINNMVCGFQPPALNPASASS